MDVTLDHVTWNRMKLPGPLGGMSLRMPASSADAAFLSKWMATKDRVGLICQELGRPARCCPGKVDALSAAERIKAAGVLVTLSGDVSFCPEAKSLYMNGPWVEDTQVMALFNGSPAHTVPSVGQGSKLHSRILRGLEALSATQAFATAPSKFHRENLISSGGCGVGKFWSTVPSHPAQHMDNDHFKMSAAIRLGIVEVPRGAVCQIEKATKNGCDDKCLQSIRMPLTHPHLCRVGPARLRPHNAIRDKLAHLLHRAGARCDKERAVPDLYRVDPDSGRVTEAILDVVSSFPGGISQTLLDVTVRCPHAGRYEKADSRCGDAAAGGEWDKQERYGDCVSPVAFETYGRLGAVSVRHLQSLASSAQARLAPSDSCRSGLCSHWRLALERVLLFEIADVVLLSLGRTTGVHARGRKG